MPPKKRPHPEDLVENSESKRQSKYKKQASLESNKSLSQSHLSSFFNLPAPSSTPKAYGTAEFQSLADLQSKRGTSTISIISWNVNGINSTTKKGCFKETAPLFNLPDGGGQPDIICVSELKTQTENASQLAMAMPAGYECYYNCCQLRIGYAGTGLFTKVKPVSVQFEMGIKSHDGEGRVLTAEFDTFILVHGYVPNAGAQLERLKYRVDKWDKDFYQFVSNLEEERGKPAILCGDLNVAHKEIDIYDTKGKEKVAGFTPQERESFDQILKDFKFIDTFRHLYPEKQEFSFFSAKFKNFKAENKGWRLDYFLLKEKNLPMLIDHIIHKDIDGSDHVPLELKINFAAGGGKPGSVSKSSKSASKAREEEKEEESDEEREKEKEKVSQKRSNSKSGRKKSKSKERKHSKSKERKFSEEEDDS